MWVQILGDQNGIKCHFIPAQSSSFGGIWEVGIKSAKSHIKRVVADKALIFEQFSTVLSQIDGMSRSIKIMEEKGTKDGNLQNYCCKQRKSKN